MLRVKERPFLLAFDSLTSAVKTITDAAARGGSDRGCQIETFGVIIEACTATYGGDMFIIPSATYTASGGILNSAVMITPRMKPNTALWLALNEIGPVDENGEDVPFLTIPRGRTDAQLGFDILKDIIDKPISGKVSWKEFGGTMRERMMAAKRLYLEPERIHITKDPVIAAAVGDFAYHLLPYLATGVMLGGHARKQSHFARKLREERLFKGGWIVRHAPSKSNSAKPKEARSGAVIEATAAEKRTLQRVKPIPIADKSVLFAYEGMALMRHAKKAESYLVRMSRDYKTVINVVHTYPHATTHPYQVSGRGINLVLRSFGVSPNASVRSKREIFSALTPYFTPTVMVDDILGILSRVHKADPSGGYGNYPETLRTCGYLQEDIAKGESVFPQIPLLEDLSHAEEWASSSDMARSACKISLDSVVEHCVSPPGASFYLSGEVFRHLFLSLIEVEIEAVLANIPRKDRMYGDFELVARIATANVTSRTLPPT
jgi:hypothetical protein